MEETSTSVLGLVSMDIYQLTALQYKVPLVAYEIQNVSCQPSLSLSSICECQIEYEFLKRTQAHLRIEMVMPHICWAWYNLNFSQANVNWKQQRGRSIVSCQLIYLTCIFDTRNNFGKSIHLHLSYKVEITFCNKTGGEVLLGACCFRGKNLPHFGRGGGWHQGARACTGKKPNGQLRYPN